MASKKNEKNSRFTAVEVCHSHLNLAIATRGETGEMSVQTHSIPWRHDAPTLNSESGPGELRAAIKLAVQEYKLQGAPIHFALNGDYCVTRVVTGTNEKVEAEMNNLEERSNLYLSLGHGKKALGVAMRPIDARNQHALLSVVNQQTLDVLRECSKESSFKLDVVEPSLVALARLLGHVGGDEGGPKLIVNLGEKGVEVGISQRGQLLLDYRPPGNAINSRLASVIVGHLGRLQRYCDRYVGFSSGQLNSAFLCGLPESVEEVGEGFRQQTTLPIQLLQPDHGRLPWTFEGETPGPQFNAVLGTLMLHLSPRGEWNTPNLMERLNALLREPLAPALLRALWPVVAVAAAVVMIVAVNVYQGMQRDGVAAELAAIKQSQEQTAKTIKDIEAAQKKLVYMRNIQKRLANPAWSELTTMIGQCLPQDAWLEGMTSDRGQMVINGGSLTQDGVYEFEKWLNTLPALTRVSLGGTETVQTSAGPAVTFNMKCDVIDYTGADGEKGRRNDNA